MRKPFTTIDPIWQSITSSGLVILSSSAPASVTSLNVDPMRILYDHCARFGASVRNAPGQFPLRDVLDLFINSEHQVLAWLRILFRAPQPFMPVVHGDEHLAWLAGQSLIELALHAAQTLVVKTHIPQRLRRQFAFGIETL